MTKAIRRLAAALSLLPALCSTMAVQAQGTADRITFVVPFPAGGVTDIAARALAEKMATGLGQTIIVENRPGGGSRIGIESVVKAVADGQTLLFTNTSYAILPVVDPSARYQPETSLAPLGMLASYGLQFVVADKVPVKTLREFIDHARARPGQLSYGSAGPGSGVHFAGEYFKALTGSYIVHIPYRSTSAALNDVAAGTVEMTLDATAKAYADAGKVRILAVTGTQRDPRLPDVPTTTEAGLRDFVFSSWVGLLAPAATPAPVLTRLNAALNHALADPQLRRRLHDLGLTPEGGSAARMQQQVRDDIAFHRRIAAQAKLRFE